MFIIVRATEIYRTNVLIMASVVCFGVVRLMIPENGKNRLFWFVLNFQTFPFHTGFTHWVCYFTKWAIISKLIESFSLSFFLWDFFACSFVRLQIRIVFWNNDNFSCTLQSARTLLKFKLWLIFWILESIY